MNSAAFTCLLDIFSFSMVSHQVAELSRKRNIIFIGTAAFRKAIDTNSNWASINMVLQV